MASISTTKKITFDLNGHDLIIANNLGVNTNSVVNYKGAGKFKVVRTVTDTNSAAGYPGLFIIGNSIIKLTGVETIVNGSGTYSEATAINAIGGSTVVVNGDVRVKGNGSTGSNDIGIDANSATVTVTGNVISSQNFYS